MKYSEFAPVPALAAHVQLIWGMESEAPGDGQPRELILPDGIVELVLHYASPFVLHHTGRTFLQPPSSMVSMMRRHLEIESSGPVGFVAVRFYPWGGYHFFAKPIAEFVDDTVRIDALWDDHAAISADVASAASMEDRVERVQRHLVARLQRFQRDEPSVDAAVRLIRETKGQMSIEQVADRVGWTQRHLSRQMLGSVGVTPKIFARVSRFLAVCHRLRANDRTSLTELTHECGFHDQPHFIREFRAFSGFTPREFCARRNVVFADL